MIIDTHIHLYAAAFDTDRDALIKDAMQQGISVFMIPNIDADSIEPMLQLQRQYPGVCLPMMGLHPCYVTEDYRTVLDQMHARFDTEIFYGIGETGIDLYWDKSTLAIQEESFKIQLEWSKEKNLPLIIHSRDSLEEILQILETAGAPSAGGIFHCFSGSIAQAQRCIDLGFLLGIGGVVTFKKSGLDALVEKTDIQHLVLETDAPYLAPTPHRGKRNIPVYIHEVAARIADIYKISKEECIFHTSQNAIRLFKLEQLHGQA